MYALEGYLFFKPVGFQSVFSLVLTSSKELGRNPLLPGAEIQLSVNQGFLNQTMTNANRHGADLNNAVVSFSLDSVSFSDELRWYRGKMVRPDSAIPGKWVSVDEPLDIWQASGWDCTLCNDGIDNDCDLEFDGVDSGDSGCNPNICASPVLVDILGNGFNLSSTANGVNFDLNSDGTREKLAWTVGQTDDAWLALDRNGDGVINNGTELFGNFTAQPKPPLGYGRNGFNALVEFDLTAKGGNADGLITERDAVFGKLLLWQDKNHNGISETSELSTLKQLGLAAIECDYKESKRRDQFGNQFRYRAKINDSRDGRISRWAWDVFLVNDQSLMGHRLMAQVDGRATGSVFECCEGDMSSARGNLLTRGACAAGNFYLH